MTEIKLIATDMDGTLLNEVSQLSEKNIQAVKDATKKGVHVVLTTGRPLKGVTKYLDELGLKDGYVITYNGALVQEVSGKVIAKHNLSMDDYITLEKISRENNVPLHIETLHHFYTTQHDINQYMVTESFLTGMNIRIRDFDEFESDMIISKGMFTGDKEVLDALYEKIPKELIEKYNFVRSEDYFLEVLNKSASKGNGILDLAEYLDIKPEEVMVLGDQGNDLSMFEVPEFYHVAMDNAIDDLKNLADMVTKTNIEDGFSYAVERKVLG